MAEKSLKEKNSLNLALVTLFNIAVYLVLLNKGFDMESLKELLSNGQQYAGVLLVGLFVAILNAQVGHANKARLTFWRWSNPLPGCRAFSEYIDTDPRIDKSALRAIQDPLPTEPSEQNALWFKWYREFQNEPGVSQVHQQYLFTRDYAAIALILLVGLGGLALWQLEDIAWKAVYIGLLVAQYLVVRQAAKNHGIRFVATVLAYKAAQK